MAIPAAERIFSGRQTKTQCTDYIAGLAGLKETMVPDVGRLIMQRLPCHLAPVSAVFILVMTASCLAADSLETRNEETKFWLNAGAGFGMWSSDFISTGEIGVSAGRRDEFLTARFTTSSQFRLYYHHPASRISEIGILYGRVLKEKPVFTAISAGLAYLQSTEYPHSFFPERSVSLGIPLELQVFSRMPFVGIGLVFFGDIGLSGRKSFGGIVLSLQFGSFR